MNAPVNSLNSLATAPAASRQSRVLHATKSDLLNDANIPVAGMSGNEMPAEPSAETPEDAYARGLNDGHTAARQKFEKLAESHKQHAALNELKLREKIQTLATATAALDELSREYNKAAEATLERLTLLACGKILSSLAAENRLASEIVSTVFAQHGKASGLTLLLNQQDFNALSGRLPAGINIAVGSELPRGEFRVNTSHRHLNVAIQQQYQILGEMLGGEISPGEINSRNVANDSASVGDSHVDS